MTDGERIIIGDEAVTVRVIKVKGQRVYLGFEGDDDIPIHREKTYRSLTTEGRAAVALSRRKPA